jgi:hypothetical protein
MDSLITAAARALASGDPLSALQRVALRNDPPALALRGVAMAQLGELTKAKSLLQRAARGFGPKESMARARCVLAEAEVALAARDLIWPAKTLDAARIVLEEQGDRINVAHAWLLEIRRQLLIGQIDTAERLLNQLDPAVLPPALRATHELAIAGIALRRIRASEARAAIARAREAAQAARIMPLLAEVESASRLLQAPAARVLARGTSRDLLLADVESLFASDVVIVDACRYTIRGANVTVPLARRPVLFSLALTLGEAWPADVPRDTLVHRAFGLKRADESLRARLRVEIGRLRKLLAPIAEVSATPHGFVIEPHRDRQLVVLLQPTDEQHPSVLALLADGESWSSSALALALGTSQRTAQRALDQLLASGKVQPLGHGRARRWMMPPLPGFATMLLLPSALPE